jgi:integrase
VGNLYVSQVSPAHFRKYHSWASRESTQRTCGKWFNDHVATVKSVIKFVRKKYPEWPWPAGVLEWADSYDARPYKPRPSNKQPMPPDVFQSLLSAADEWKRIDTVAFDTSTQAGRARKNQALHTRRDGWQLDAILRLGINCGLDPIDCERITWENLRIDADTPHMRLPCRKVESRIGDSVERITPLLPSTVNALEAWRAFEKRSRGQVFLSAAKGLYRKDRLGRVINRLRESKGISNEWSFKHLRNVVPSLGRRHRRPRDERDAFLGHVVAGTSRFYEGDVDETYLLPLINLLGKHYFDGEKVKRGRKSAAP